MDISEREKLIRAYHHLEAAISLVSDSCVTPSNWRGGVTALKGLLSWNEQRLEPTILSRVLKELEILEELNEFPAVYRQHLMEAAAQMQHHITHFITGQLRFADQQLRRIETDLAGENDAVEHWASKHSLSVMDTRKHFLSMADYTARQIIEELAGHRNHGRMASEQELHHDDLSMRAKEVTPKLSTLGIIPLSQD